MFGWVTGKGGLELGPEWSDFKKKLATPPFPFHIVAGDIDSPIPNPLVDGESDFVVSIDEAKLDGAENFVIVPVLHSFLMDNDDVVETTIKYLFEDERRQSE